MTHPELANTFEAVAEHGREGFYKGRIAQGESLLFIHSLCHDKC